MQQQGRDYQHYLQSLQTHIKDKLETSQKLYLEVTGNLIDQSDIREIIPNFEMDTYKKTFSPFKYDMDILLCIKAQDVINNSEMGPDKKPFRDFLQLYLKKVENQFGIKPHIVINGIDIENMYDIVFNFETAFQKLGYRVWEKYKIRAYTEDMPKVLSEDGFGNDDHIPTTKKLNLIIEMIPECWKLPTAIAQIYLDQEIGIASDYAKLAVLPNYDTAKTEPCNVMARAQYLRQTYLEDFDSTLKQKDLYERGVEQHTFIQKAFKLLKKPVPEFMSDYVFGRINDAQCDEEALQLYIEKLKADSKNSEISEQLEQLLEERE